MKRGAANRPALPCRRFALAVLCALGLAGCGGADGGAADDPGEPAPSLCAEMVCGAHEVCDEESGACVCAAGYVTLGGRCVLDAPADADADGEAFAESPEADDAEAAPDADADEAPAVADLDAEGEGAPFDDACPVPQAPTLSVVPVGTELAFTVPDGFSVETAVAAAGREPDAWRAADRVALDALGDWTVHARLDDPACHDRAFVFTYAARESFPPAAGQDGSTALSKDDSAFVGWASRVVDYAPDAEVGANWRDADLALGPAAGGSMDIVSLGDGGKITLGFERPISDGPGSDFAVFENGFSDTFLELAWVEVGSDGRSFVRFDGAYLGTEPVGGYGTMPTTRIGGLAGKYRQGWGQPYDLAELANRPEVLDGRLDLNRVRYVRIVDIPGDGAELDSFGRPIYDPYPTLDSVGFDLDAVGVLHAAEGDGR